MALEQNPKFLPKEHVLAIKELYMICQESVAGSQCYEWGSSGYKDSIRHYLASSSEVAQLAVQPGSAKDLAKMMKVLKNHPVSFAIKGGGHGMSPTFSSTTGIQIYMTRLSQVRYDPKTELVEIGAGCLWDQVYSSLSPYGRNVVGGSASEGVGVGGWLLGGGYSLKSNKHGLGIDNIVRYEIVTPDGHIRDITAERNPELFDALRGGCNNFGIVTKFVLKTHPQGLTYGAYLVTEGIREPEFKDAIVKYLDEEKRKEAVMVAAFRHILKGGEVEGFLQHNLSVFCVFDGEKPNLRRDLPFRQFASLATTGDVWKADPAGWQLGRTEISTRDKSLPRLLSVPRRHKRTAVIPKESASQKNSKHVSDNSTTTRNVQSASEEQNITAVLEEDGEDESDSSEPEFDTLTYESLYGLSDTVAAPTAPIHVEPPSNVDTSGTSPSPALALDPVSSDAPMFISFLKSPPRPSPVHKALKGEFKTPNDLQRIIVTKKIDKMGELNERGRFGSIMVSRYTRILVDALAEEANAAAQSLTKHRGLSIVIDCWPVHPAIFDNSRPGAAFPHYPGQPFGPMLVFFKWENEDDDIFWVNLLQDSLERLRVVAQQEGVIPQGVGLYNNLSLNTVPAEKIYGPKFEELQKVKKKYDPSDVMGRAGGHKIPLPAHKKESQN